MTILQLSPQTMADIERNIAKYPPEQKQSAVMAALIAAQTEIGWVSDDVIETIAEILGMPRIAVDEVATFYNMYDTKPVGKYKLVICTNLPCQLTHGETAATHLKKTLGIGYNETTPCGTFTLKEGECMGACGDSPVMLVNNKRMCSFMSNEKIDALLTELRAQGKSA
ncbi:NADH-quinone oxidoreductase subunit NuoE [Polynucleobacter paneuropaeus]|jgi:NADH-quinone oxidoreductase subunit E|uniref:NADH-quinone oxidoreductase subunit NuoE n=1 Tax=Polynucleobacter paneuropaeus TaxID=2527775 RepID=A0A9Q7CQC9_9BURK|nr:NADH-quinone oxidoreductase subunit NuoE [Polynucleobacter paneuropaeus]AWW48125.1 NADH-quinone oxidoreductase subunit NuoE [Polynucleobacter paneuropaeus]MBT8522514.1 NADH-quinone oxidoreductase subunit NuoE [Polynucleobacter paneuropaeus]MBT8527439.1 NADH-quinone oxidoreductase subunit NuoE [Polynucleobacter paneuropaeus]MBT8528368.1 NADH-quinone oxidoreductase subunit NuoE [Polynucleobacter paneuropaeus]MBT8534101.1 NADH-quinone oxidoreductase subunit NuoE [Polynucleobacter paneuropaeus]